jgi:hypothetical protein
LDFKLEREDAFCIGDNSISCDVEALNSACRVTFNNLPERIKTLYGENPEMAKRKFQEQLQRINVNFVFSEIWRSGENYGWTMTVNRFSEEEDE